MNIYKNKTILVTGGTGSFGKSFVKFLIEKSDAKKIIIFSRDELKQFNMQKEFKNNDRLRFFIGDIRDKDRLDRAFYGVDIIVHAAALKQVPTLEYNPFEAVKTNILGSENVINAAINQGIEKVLLISTDKAAHPVNLYGSTKLCAEKLFISGNSYSGGRTRFSCVRYGNVIGSRGSIIDTLKSNPNLDKVDLTDENMTRFWITLKQSHNLVNFALSNMQGGEIFIPKIPSMKVKDIFTYMTPKAEINIIGIRPGEKMHETLLTKEESLNAIELEKYYVVLPQFKVSAPQADYSYYFNNGKKLKVPFIFASDTNTDWLDKERFNRLSNE